MKEDPAVQSEDTAKEEADDTDDNGVEEENEDLANEEEEDGEGEESIQQRLVHNQGPFMPQPMPYTLIDNIKMVALEKRQPKPFYPSSQEMSVGNVRHTVHDKISVIDRNGKIMVPAKRTMNILQSLLTAELNTEASNIVEELLVETPLDSSQNDEFESKLELVTVLPPLEPAGKC